MDGRVRLLGAFQLTMAGEPVELAPLGERLLAYLALHPNSCRERVAGVLWGEKGCAQATAGLRTALWRLPRPGDASLVRSDGNRLSLAVDLDVDLLLWQWSAHALLHGGSPPASLDGFGRDLLPGWYDEWLVDEQERWRQLRMHALERASDHAREEGDIVLALDAGLLAVAAEPLRESAHRRVIAAHLAEGNAAEALRQVLRYLDELVANGLQPRPSPALSALLDGVVEPASDVARSLATACI